jgi:glyoxylase-like metal-dependent hydrolase (beta-lactamase superfamily II)
LLEDGDVLPLGSRRFEVIHTPGHSPGGIALWEAATGVLVAGDILYDGPLIEDTYHSDAADYVRSMRRLRDVPARVVHGGHFPSFPGERMRAMIDDWLRAKGA